MRAFGLAWTLLVAVPFLCCNDHQSQGTYVASTSQKEETESQSRDSCFSEKGAWKRIQKKGEKGSLHPTITPFLEPSRLTEGDQDKSSNDVVLHRMQNSECSTSRELPRVFKALDQSMDASEAIQKSEKAQDTQSIRSFGCQGYSDINSAHQGGRGWTGLDERHVPRTGSLDSNHTTRKTSTQSDRRDVRCSGFQRITTTSTASFAKGAGSDQCRRSSFGKGAEDVEGLAAVARSGNGIVTGTEADQGKLGVKNQGDLTEGFGTWPLESTFQNQISGRDCQSQSAKAGLRMEQVPREHHEEDPVSFGHVRKDQGRAHGGAEQEDAGLERSQDRDGSCFQGLVGRRHAGGGEHCSGDRGVKWRVGKDDGSISGHRHSADHGHGRRGRRDVSRAAASGHSSRRDSVSPHTEACTTHHIQSVSESGGYHTPEEQEGWQGGQAGCMSHLAKNCDSPLRSVYEANEGHESERAITAEHSRTSKTVTFHEEVSVRIWSQDANEEHFDRIVNQDIFHGWCRAFWHIEGQMCSWNEICAGFDSPQLHSPSMFEYGQLSIHDGSYESRCEHDQSTDDFMAEHDGFHSKVGEGAWSSFLHKHQNCLPRQAKVVTWFLRQDHFHVCVQPRVVPIALADTEVEVENKCITAWFDLLGDEDVEVHFVSPRPHDSPSHVAHLIVGQGFLVGWKSLLIYSDALPILRRHRAVLVQEGDDTSRIFNVGHLARVNDREQRRCVLQQMLPQGEQMFRDHEVPVFRNADLMKASFQIWEVGSSEEDNGDVDSASEGGISTQVPDDEYFMLEEDDVSSLVSHGPSAMRLFPHNAYPWENTGDLAENQADTMEEEEDSPAFAPMYHQIQALVDQAHDQMQSEGMLIVTFGLGLVQLGRRDIEVYTARADEVIEAVATLWQDHEQYGDIAIHPISNQPQLEVGRPYVALLVDIAYPGVTMNERAVLVKRNCADDVDRNSRHYAARMAPRTTPWGIMMHLNIDHGVYPNGVREYQVERQDQILQNMQATFINNGDLLNIWIGSYPRHVQQAAGWMQNHETFFMDLREMNDMGGGDLVRCVFHGSSPANNPLGRRELYLEQWRIFDGNWRTQAIALWPFERHWEDAELVYSFVEEPVAHPIGQAIPTYHFVISYHVQLGHIPVLFRQYITAVEARATHEELLAYDIDAEMDMEELRHTLDRRHFWVQEQFRFTLGRWNIGAWRPGEIVEIRLLTHRISNIVAVLLDVAADREMAEVRDMMQLESVSLLQTDVHRTSVTPFEEICASLLQDAEQNPGMRTEDNVNPRKTKRGQTEVFRQDVSGEADRVQRSLSDGDYRTIHDLQRVLADMSKPWTGLSLDFQLVPRHHPMAVFACENTDFSESLTNSFHVFTDGSCKKGYMTKTGEWRSPTAAWAFVVLCEFAVGQERRFIRIGYSADRLGWMPDHGDITPANAEAWAIIAMSEYLLSIPQQKDMQIHCHFDAQAVGFGAFGWQRSPKQWGQDNEIQKHARIMVSLVQQRCTVTQPIHVHAHEGSPFNELADSLAGACRRGWNPPVRPNLRSMALMKHPLKEWAWLEIRLQDEIPGLEELLRNEHPYHQKGWPDATIAKLGKPTPSQSWCAKFRIATINVGTLTQEQSVGGASLKASELARQFDQQGIDLIGLQECRSKHTQTAKVGEYVRLIAASDQGQAGVELWLHIAALEKKLGCRIKPHDDVCVRYSSPRILAATITTERLKLQVCVCYAPQRGRTLQEIQAWWDEFDNVVQQGDKATDMVWLGDWNCRVGSVETDAIGELAADLEDAGGALFRHNCGKHQMVLPSTHHEFHDGQSWTYCNSQGHRSRIDFIAVSSSMVAGIDRSWVDSEIDVMNGDVDHSVVLLELSLQGQAEAEPMLVRKSRYDRDAARRNKVSKQIDLMESLSVQGWYVDVNHHWSYMRDHIQERSATLFPKKKRQQRQSYFSPTTWNLLCQRKELRQQHRQLQRDSDFSTLQLIFQAWKTKQPDSRKLSTQLHLATMQSALTLKMRQDVDHAFRAQKKVEWKQWVVQQMDRNVEQLSQRGAKELFRVLQPKKMIARSQGKMRQSVPGLREGDGTWAVGKRAIATAWQRQFAALEHAQETSMNHLLEASCPNVQPHTIKDLQEIPTLYDVERALHMLNDKKATGLDDIGAELLQTSIPSTAKKIMPLILKAVLRGQTTPDLTGGWLLPLFKGKGSGQAMPGYRGIMLEATMARVISKSWRSRVERCLEVAAMPMQYGGRAGLCTEALHLQTRLWMSTAKSERISVSLVFVDIRAAFYSVAKQMLTGCKQPDSEIPNVFKELGLPETALDAFTANMLSTKALQSAGGSEPIIRWVDAMLRDSWFALPNANTLMKPMTGSRPGDPIADCLFGLIMSKWLQAVVARLEATDVWDDTPDNGEMLPVNLTWVDDTAFAVFAPAEKLVERTLKALAVIIDTAVEFGLSLTFGASKTTTMCSFHGTKAVESRQNYERMFPQTLPVVTEHLGVVKVDVTNHYKHLGGMLVRGGSLMPELKIRAAVTATKMQPLKKVLADDRLELQQRRTLLNMMCMSVATLYAGTWFDMTFQEFGTWQGLIHRLYSSLCKRQHDTVRAYEDAYSLALHADSPMAMELLHLAKLKLFVHIVKVGDELMIGAILHNMRCAGASSWWAGLRRSCYWLQEQLGVECLPDQFDRLDTFEAWKELTPRARDLHKLVRKARRSHLMRVQTLVALKGHMKFQKQVCQDLGWTLPEDLEQKPVEDKICCDECDYQADTHAALAVHMAKKHGQRIALRKYAKGSICPICCRQYHTRVRLIQHWHWGSTDCWFQVLRKYRPMNEDETLVLDEKDKIDKTAAHQRGVRTLEADRVWRNATDEEVNTFGLDILDIVDAEQGEPTQEELKTWSKMGTLPPGKGGRPKTQRKQTEDSMRHVDADTRNLELEQCKRAKQWAINPDHVPLPMADTRKFVLLLFSGHRRWGDIASWLSWNGELIPIPVDLAVDPQHGDIFQSHLWVNLIRAKKVVASHGAPPCETYSLARWNKIDEADGPGPRPLRDAQHPWGLWERSMSEVQQVTFGTLLMLQALRLLWLTYLHGGCYTMEHPRGPTAPGRQWSIWQSGFVLEMMQAHDVGLLDFLQGPLGQPFAKPTRLLCGRLQGMAKKIFEAYDLSWRPTQVLAGKRNGRWRTEAAKIYPTKLSKALAEAYIDFSRQLVYQGQVDDPEGLEIALAALTGHWDPYVDAQQMVGMQADYNPAKAIRWCLSIFSM